MTAPQQEGARRHLLSLPSELIVAILARCNPTEVSTFSQCSRTAHTIVTEESEAIHRLMAIRRGWTRECTNGSSGLHVGQLYDPRPDVTGEDELKRAIAAQRVHGLVHIVRSWRELARLRRDSEIGWHKGTGRIRYCWLPGPVDRFKLDAERGEVIWSGGGLSAVWVATYPHGSLRQTIDAPRHTHVEYSEGTLAFVGQDRSLEIWQRENSSFVRSRTIRPANEVRAYKARFPAIVTASWDGRFSVHDMRNGQELQTGALPHDVLDLFYVDLDQQHVYVCTTSGTFIFARDRSSTLLHTVCTESLSEVIMGPYASAKACHVDQRSGRFLVVLLDYGNNTGGLVIHDLRGHTQSIVTQFRPVPEQLSVENGRCVFSTAGWLHSDQTFPPTQSVFAFLLPSDDYEGTLLANAPLIQCLDPVFPALAPIVRIGSMRAMLTHAQSRIEQDSRRCYVTANAAMRDQAQVRAFCANEYIADACWDDAKWTNLNGPEVGAQSFARPRLYSGREPDSHSVQAFVEELWRAAGGAVPQGRQNDEIWTFEFSARAQ